MRYIDIVDESDSVAGRATFEEAHTLGLRHRSVQDFVFEQADYRRLLVSQRGYGPRHVLGKGQFNPSAAGHLNSGEDYMNAGYRELQEELFHGVPLPKGLTLAEVARYRNDDRPENRENTCLLAGIHPGPFSPDLDEVAAIAFRDRDEVWHDMQSRPEAYTRAFINAMVEFRMAF